MMQCANSYYLAQYEAEQSRGDERAEWIETTARVKLSKMYPMSRENIDEALGEILSVKMHSAELVAVFNGESDACLGNLIRETINAYWLGYCTAQAADEYDDGER